MSESGSITGVNYLPTFPLELQIAILSLLPPNHLFFLRRVCHSWNKMLCNDHLLNAINDRIPYLTSAPDFTSRMKRRMRMARGEPVWVKRFSEAFPNWALDLEIKRPYVPWASIKFWSGWLVFLTAPVVSGVIGCLNASAVRLSIKDLARGANQADIEVDLLALFKRANPELYKEWIEELGERTVKQVSYSHFHVQDGKVVVGFEASSARSGQQPSPYSSQDVNRIVHGTFLLVLNIRTGNLIQHIYQPYTADSYNYLLVLQLSDSHVFTVTRTEKINAINSSMLPQPTRGFANLPRRERPVYDASTGEKLDYQIQYLINAYSIEQGTGMSLKSPHVQEVVILDPKAVPSSRPPVGSFPTSEFSSEGIACPAKLTTFDKAGRVWFPYIPDGIISTHLPQQGMIYETAENINDTEQAAIQFNLPMRDMSRSKCGKWCIFSMLQPIRAPTISLSGSLKNPVSREQRPLQASEKTTTMLESFNRSFHVVDILNHPKTNIYTEQREGDEYDIPHEQDCENVGDGTVVIRKFTPSPGNPDQPASLSHQVRINLPFQPSPPRSTYYTDKFTCTSNTASERTPAVWGYLAQDVITAVGIATDDSIVTPNREVYNNLYLLPFHSNGELRRNEGESPGNMVVPTDWQGLRNGLPWELTKHRLVQNTTTRYYPNIRVKWLFGDDGLVGWGVWYMQAGPFNPPEGGRCELWLSCYEEEWVDECTRTGIEARFVAMMRDGWFKYGDILTAKQYK